MVATDEPLRAHLHRSRAGGMGARGRNPGATIPAATATDSATSETQETGSNVVDLGRWRSRLSDSNRRPTHYKLTVPHPSGYQAVSSGAVSPGQPRCCIPDGDTPRRTVQRRPSTDCPPPSTDRHAQTASSDLSHANKSVAVDITGPPAAEGSLHPAPRSFSFVVGGGANPGLGEGGGDRRRSAPIRTSRFPAGGKSPIGAGRLRPAPAGDFPPQHTDSSIARGRPSGG